ncbi:MAG: glycosyltransferase family 4 protein [Planctomycetaceae bacterium]|nr:glycosyltransferase family 4 protein [Planctomycetaceae bacterium]
MPYDRSLVVLPSLPAVVRHDGQILLTQKFVTGMEQYVERWPGPVVAIMQRSATVTNNLDSYAVDPATLPFQVRVMRYGDLSLAEELAHAGVVLTGADCAQNHVVPLCRKLRVPVVTCSEYSLQTRWQIARTETRNPLRRWRRMAWEWTQERTNRENVRLATGVQCNGTPTFEAYQPLNPRTLLYFDTRTTDAMIIPRTRLVQRLQHLEAGKPLRLAFSGRLIAMKGADHLPRIAQELRRLQVPFEMTICGDGDLRPRIAAEVARAGLDSCVKLPGVLDFAQQLTPLLQDEIDLFVCPHRQGDPSCTYLETMACGVPIVGYANEAWSGLLRQGVDGWSVPIDDYRGLARQIGLLAMQRPHLADASVKVREFAQSHTFEQVFSRRIDHLLACAARSEQTVGGEVVSG